MTSKGCSTDKTSRSIDLASDIVVLDLSAVYDSDALGILMTCAAAWLQGVLARASDRKTIFVLDEAWAILSNLGIAKWLQASFKLSRARGLQNIAVMHRFSDLAATGPRGASRNVSRAGSCPTPRRRSSTRSRTPRSRRHETSSGSPTTEAALLPQLERGVALWKVGERSFLVWHRLGTTRTRADRHRRPHGESET